MSNSSLNSLIHVCCDSTLQSYDPQPAVNHWSEMVNHRPGARTKRSTDNDSTDEFDSDPDTNSETTSALSDNSDESMMFH